MYSQNSNMRPMSEIRISRSKNAYTGKNNIKMPI